MVDIHCHILPGIDDGASSMEEACEMAYMAYESGVDTIVVTPHSIPGYFENYYNEDYIDAVNTFRQILKEEDIPVEIVEGMEVFGSDEVISLLQNNLLRTIHGSRYLLIEFDFHDEVERVQYVLQQVMEAGYVPVIAHPERYEFVQRDVALCLDWVAAGYVLQVNKGSLLGRFGRRVKKAADWMMNHGIVDVIGSDAHSPWQRTPHMREVYHYICEYYSEECAQLLLDVNPKKIIMNQSMREELSYEDMEGNLFVSDGKER